MVLEAVPDVVLLYRRLRGLRGDGGREEDRLARGLMQRVQRDGYDILMLTIDAGTVGLHPRSLARPLARLLFLSPSRSPSRLLSFSVSFSGSLSFSVSLLLSLSLLTILLRSIIIGWYDS